MVVGGGRYGAFPGKGSVIGLLQFCSLLALLCFSALSMAALSAAEQEFDHLATGYPLIGKHEVISCESCHFDGVFKGLPTNCSGCHDGLVAFGQPPTHIPTNEQCDACHDVNSFTMLGVMDHNATAMACVNCHNGISASGKPVRHLPTANICDSCHAVIAWVPIVTFDHNDALGTCVACHDGVNVDGKHRRHANTSDNCDACHGTVDFSPVRRVDHNEVFGTCASIGCHSVPLNHFRTTQFCDACHNTSRWEPVQRLDHNELLGSCADSGCHTQPPFHASTTRNCEACHGSFSWTPLKGPVNHSEVITGQCTDCHEEIAPNIQGIVAPGQPINHIPTNGQSCDLCHSTVSWIPAQFTHGGIVSNCLQCHTLGVNATPKPVTHIPTQDLCEACHSTIAWIPVLIVDHTQVLGACAGCHDGVLAAGKGPGHVQTVDACDSCHSTTAWIPAAIDHSGFSGNCISCHDGVSASGKLPTHISSGNVCDACHMVFPATWAPVAPSRVDHSQVNGSCVSCHNNTPFSGKPPTHINTTDNCDRCHVPGPVPWAPVAANAVDHGEVLGVCSGCHNGTTAVGKTPTHVVTADECDTCHNTAAWIPATATPDHSAFVGNCVSCHNGTNASGKGTTHIATSDACDICHDKFPATWTPVQASRVDHTQVQGTCISCHNNTVRAGKSPNHLATSDVCDACHLEGPNPWTPVPVSRVDHLQVVGICSSCHNGNTASGKSAGHILSTDACDACHEVGPAPWAPVTPNNIDHLNVIGTCVSCHLLPANHCDTGTLGDQCDACHSGPVGGVGSSWLNTSQGCGGAAPGGTGLTAVISAPTILSSPVNTPISFSSAGSVDPAGGLLSYSWSFGDGGIATTANPSYTYTTAALVYTVTLTVTSTSGGISTDTINLCISSGFGGGMMGGGGPGGGVVCP